MNNNVHPKLDKIDTVLEIEEILLKTETLDWQISYDPNSKAFYILIKEKENG